MLSHLVSFLSLFCIATVVISQKDIYSLFPDNEFYMNLDQDEIRN